MIVRIFKCDLCRHQVDDGYRLQFSGDGAISFARLSDEKASEVIVCLACVEGLKYAMSRIPETPDA